MTRFGNTLLDRPKRSTAVAPEPQDSEETRGGVMPAHVIIGTARGDEHGGGTDVEADGSRLSVLQRPLSFGAPLVSEVETTKLAVVDGRAQYLFTIPRALMPCRLDPM